MADRVSDIIEELYRDTAPRLWRSLFLFAGDPEIASDAVAETFARALAAGEANHQMSALSDGRPRGAARIEPQAVERDEGDRIALSIPLPPFSGGE